MIYYFFGFVVLLFLLNQFSQILVIRSNLLDLQVKLHNSIHQRYEAFMYFRDKIEGEFIIDSSITNANYNENARVVNRFAIVVFDYLNSLNDDFMTAPINEAIDTIKVVESEYISAKKGYINTLGLFEKRSQLPYVLLFKKISPKLFLVDDFLRLE